MTEAELLSTITDHYLDSRDFNGYPLRGVGLDRDELDGLLRSLISQS